MNYFYPIIEGKKQRHEFFENWSEVPVTTFIKWNKIALELDVVNSQIVDIYAELYEAAEKLQLAKLKDDKQVKKLERKVNQKQRQLEPLINKQHELELEGVSLFCSVPIEVLADMKTDLKVFINNKEHDVEIDDSHFQTYKNALELLASQALPSEAINHFYFQTKTDKEIEELEQEFSKYTIFGKLSKKAKQLKKELKKAKRSKYEIKDIWLQTTLANKEFQDMANRIIQQFEQGDFSELIYLISMLTVESNLESEALKELRESKAQGTYIEKYRDKFLEIYKQRVKLFTEQKVKLDVETMMRIKSFFLLKWKTFQKTSLKS